jgi:hypothetical protein
MPRDEFYRRYAAIRSTHGEYTDAELSAFNAKVFADVAVLNADDLKTRGIVDHYFRQAFDAARAAALAALRDEPPTPDEAEPAPDEPAPKPEPPSDDSAPDDESGARILFLGNNYEPHQSKTIPDESRYSKADRSRRRAFILSSRLFSGPHRLRSRAPRS